jgi:hypothetical protein
MINKSRRSFLRGVVAAAIAAAVPLKLTLKEKKALASDNRLTAAQANKIEKKLIEAVYNPIQRRQEFCLHLKGGRWIKSADNKISFMGSRRPLQDFSIGDHTFIDGTRRVNCLQCFKKWYPDKPGWEEAEYMLKHTTNTRTSSQCMGRTFKGRFYPFGKESEKNKSKVVFLDKL